MARVHPVDRAAGVAFRRLPRHLRVFRDGWGAGLDEWLPLGGLPTEPDDLDISWGPAVLSKNVVGRHGTFLSHADHLPDVARTGHLYLVQPPGGYDRLVVLMAAWNDHGYATREGIAQLLTRRGIASVIPENPYYGKRRVFANQAIRTVVDFALMTQGAVNEARSLLLTFANEATTLGVAGYSMGGSLAALVAATAPHPVRAAPLAASYSPAPVFVYGALSGAVEWIALGPDGRDKLFKVLSTADVRDFPAPPLADRAVLAGANGDGYVPRDATEAIHRHWPGSQMRWFDAGHATLMLRRKELLVEAIADAMV
ncbi:MAG: alpha/beta hydrolase family protein [Acidimicrobiia bacterium]|nr:alpha/beta hydrolase family protein [Acidimicrobiia bacterium]